MWFLRNKQSVAARARFATFAKPSKNNVAPTSSSSKFTKLSPIEHILQRSDTYVGSTKMSVQPMWVLADHEKLNKPRIVEKSIKYVPALYKIFDEILVNAMDNKVRDPAMTSLHVTIANVSMFLFCFVCDI